MTGNNKLRPEGVTGKDMSNEHDQLTKSFRHIGKGKEISLELGNFHSSLLFFSTGHILASCMTIG
jgi:hypothetical protein